MYVEFSASAELQRIIGYLGMINMIKRYRNTDGVSVALASKHCAQQACASNHAIPCKDEEWHATHRTVDEDAWANFCNAVSLLNADAAGDEKRAMELLGCEDTLAESIDVANPQLKVDLQEVANTFPNHLVSNEDKTHAATRIPQRGWAATPACRETYTNMVGSTTSPTMIIQSSPQWQQSHGGLDLGEKHLRRQSHY